MTRIPVRMFCCAVLLLGWTGAARSQDPSDKPLGNAAREQKEVRPATQPEKVYRNQDVESSPSPRHLHDGGSSSEGVPKPQTQPQEPAPAEPKSTAREPYESHRMPKRSVLDHRIDEDDADDKLIVPEGTELKVEIPAASDFPQGVFVGRVAAPVRLSFSTAIPALSAVNVKVVGRYYPLDASYYTLSYFEALEVTQVTVEGVPYAVQTDRVGRSSSFASAELTFKLLAPLAIQR